MGVVDWLGSRDCFDAPSHIPMFLLWVSVCKLFTFSSSLPEPLEQFQPNFPWVNEIQVCWIKRSQHFPRKDNKKIVKISCSSNKLGTKHLWVKGIQTKFSLPELKVQVSLSDCLLSVCPFVFKLFTF